MVLDFNNDTYDNKREFTGNKERENFYIYENICGLSHTKTANKNSKHLIDNQISPLQNRIAHLWGPTALNGLNPVTF